MLSEQHRALIKATIPLLETGGEALTTHFYQLMFREHPEVKVLFNSAHQSSGAQPRALANSVLMYARHIDHLEALGPLVGQIVHKHAALQVLPEHYPIVGSCLLRSIREVLGAEIATDAILEAWGAAYQQLADLLIQAEEGVYAQNAQAVGGWRGSRGFILARKVVESSEITSFYLVPEDGQPVIKGVPGQFIGLRLILDGEELRRNYSLSACSDGQTYRISVKRDPEGRVSRYLHDHFQVGDRVEVFPPAGDFVLDNSELPLVLISGGVGITPAIAMLEQALKTSRPIYFIHCARSVAVHAFREWLETQAQTHSNLRLYFCYSAPLASESVAHTGFLTAERLAQWLPTPPAMEVYFTGSTPFMAQVKQGLTALGVPEAHQHYEFFGPAVSLTV